MEESRRPREKGAPQLPPTPTDAPTVDQAFVNDLRVQLLNQQVELQNRPQKASRRAAIGSEFAPNFKIDKVPLEKIDTLAPQQRRFTNDLLQLLKLPNKGSQAQILSSAIAVTERIKDRGETSEDYIEAVELCKRVTNAGTPPWLDPKAAMIATDAKVHLDLLSIPKETRALTNFASGTNNTCCWVNRAGDELDQKHSFLCKPNSRGSVSVIGGVPPQGEVPREALSGCLAKELMLCGIDVPIPETHVIQLASSYFPKEVQSKYTADKLTCSVQQYQTNLGSLKEKQHDPNHKDKISAKQIASIAIFDIIALNSDRHAGNLLVSPAGNLIPIDHGTTFSEPTTEGVGRIQVTMGGTYNALLHLPGAFEPLSKDMQGMLSKNLDPEKVCDSLKQSRNLLASAHGETAGKISDDALRQTRRMMRFVQIASQMPEMSPALIQVALARSLKLLLSFPDDQENKFNLAAMKALLDAAKQKHAIKAVCLASNEEYLGLVRRAEELGWKFQKPNTVPDEDVLSDPVLLLNICTLNLRNEGDVNAQLELARKGAKPEDQMRALLTTKLKTCNQLLNLLSLPVAAKFRLKLGPLLEVAQKQSGNAFSKGSSGAVDGLSLLIADANSVAIKELSQKMFAFMEDYDIDINTNLYFKAFWALYSSGDAVALAKEIANLVKISNRWKKKAAGGMANVVPENPKQQEGVEQLADQGSNALVNQAAEQAGKDDVVTEEEDSLEDFGKEGENDDD